MNEVTLIGRLVKEPELKWGQSGKEYLFNTLAIRHSFPDADGSYGTDYIDFTAFGAAARVIDTNCAKGKMICLKCKLQKSERTAQDGSKTYALQVIVNSVELIDFVQKEEQCQEPTNRNIPLERKEEVKEVVTSTLPQSENKTPYDFDIAGDDLPF